ncbi:hypothetical protein APHACPA_1403 [Rickettsia amblyommatis str. Ac/Pa]|uniref:Uncharacterized protein n=1 Tax=Rickettsia amblyommatis str. Ac/Pa TaxID=1359164 RepID=A0A0F3N2W3_RICAM|nr:hypothetical protein APHACPA_1403 [Rickettsia amblyommatis str. Ac/Pa]
MTKQSSKNSDLQNFFYHSPRLPRSLRLLAMTTRYPRNNTSWE